MLWITGFFHREQYLVRLPDLISHRGVICIMHGDLETLCLVCRTDFSFTKNVKLDFILLDLTQLK